MATLVHEIANRLTQFGALTGTGGANLGFVVLERWPVRPSGDPDNPIKGETPEAFDNARARRMKRTIAVMGRNEVPNPGRQASDLRRWDSYPELYMFAEAQASGKDALQAAYLLVESYLVGWQVLVSTGRAGFLPDTIIGPDDSPDFPESVFQVCRFRVTGTRRLVAVP